MRSAVLIADDLSMIIMLPLRKTDLEGSWTCTSLQHQEAEQECSEEALIAPECPPDTTQYSGCYSTVGWYTSTGRKEIVCGRNSYLGCLITKGKLWHLSLDFNSLMSSHCKITWAPFWHLILFQAVCQVPSSYVFYTWWFSSPLLNQDQGLSQRKNKS